MDKNLKPKLSIISPSLNTGRFLQATIDSIMAQSYKDFEYIVADGGSTDGTLETLKNYPGIRVISEKGMGYWKAIDVARTMAQGDYIMNCSISDGYLDVDWFRKCVEALDADQEVSLIWGFPQYMDEAGNLLALAYAQFHHMPAPQKEEFFYYWLASSLWLPEGNFCVRKSVFQKCLSTEFLTSEEVKRRVPWLDFSFNFNAGGYLSLFLSTVASYGRIHAGQAGERDFLTEFGERISGEYFRRVGQLRKKILWGGAKHVYRDGMGNKLPYAFSRWHFFRSEVLSLRTARGHLWDFLKRRAKNTLYFLKAKKLMPKFLMSAVVAKRQKNFGIKQ